MIYREFCGEKLSLLGFGTMRLPLLADGSVDEAQTAEMTALALQSGVNYFDTAYPYHGGNSELVMGRILNRFPRKSWLLADKYPGHQIADRYDPAEIFEIQLQKCGVDYFDFYLLHNVCENSYGVYTDPQWRILEYFKEQKRRGRIRHLGFSSHAQPDCLRQFLDYADGSMEFCQIQMNYIDWTLQDAKAKYELLTERGLGVWVMEPLRGGKLARLPEQEAALLSALRPDESGAAWALRWLQRFPGVKMILSGMSDLSQMRDNLQTFSSEKPLSDAEAAQLAALAVRLTDAVPCTACRYCCDGCPMGLDIPKLIGAYNDQKFHPAFTAGMMIDSLPESKRPAACIACGRCSAVCPQKIDVPDVLRRLTDELASHPSWAQVCKERAAAAAKQKENSD